jgi:acyl carrier protein phosphodiesterase
MNYLAHAVLSFENDSILVGQFIADDVKGKHWMNYETDIKKGILLHRFIDDFTDNHPSVLQLKSRLYSSLGKFAGVALDVLFDHCLSIRWEHHLASNRVDSIARFYETLQANRTHLSEKRLYILARMIEYDWMNMYADREGTERILLQMSRRITLENPLHRAWEAFELHEKHVISSFDTFFPELLSAANAKYDTFAP